MTVDDFHHPAAEGDGTYSYDLSCDKAAPILNILKGNKIEAYRHSAP